MLCQSKPNRADIHVKVWTENQSLVLLIATQLSAHMRRVEYQEI